MKVSPSLIAKGILAVATGNTEISSLKVGARARQADRRNMLCPGGISVFLIPKILFLYEGTIPVILEKEIPEKLFLKKKESEVEVML